MLATPLALVPATMSRSCWSFTVVPAPRHQVHDDALHRTLHSRRGRLAQIGGAYGLREEDARGIVRRARFQLEGDGGRAPVREDRNVLGGACVRGPLRETVGHDFA